MATINAHKSKTGITTYRVRVQRRGQKTMTATFPSLKEARKWATMIEGDLTSIATKLVEIFKELSVLQ